MRLWTSLIVAMSLALGGAAQAQTTGTAGAEEPENPLLNEQFTEAPAAGDADGQEGPYRLAPGAVIEVQVLEDPSLNRQLLVQPDGLISFPLAGTIQAGGKTPSELADDIRDGLTDDFLDPPTVTVALIATSQEDEEMLPTFYVLGQVAAPGRFQVEEPVSILQALAIAGGPGVFAAKKRIQVRKRTEDGTEMLRIFDLESVEDGQLLTDLIEIGDGDVIFVPERGLFE